MLKKLGLFFIYPEWQVMTDSIVDPILLEVNITNQKNF